MFVRIDNNRPKPHVAIFKRGFAQINGNDFILVRAGPAKLALFACSASAIAEPGPIVKASVGNELFGPKLPEKVLLLRMRQKPPATVRDLGLSMVAVGWGAAAPAKRSIAAAIVDKHCP